MRLDTVGVKDPWRENTMNKLKRLTLFLIVTVAAGGCGVSVDNPFTPPIYAVHYWDEQDGQILRKAVESFESINGSTIYLENSETVSKSLVDQLAAGLGPDVIIGLPYSDVIPLAEAGLIRDISQYDIDFDSYLPEHLRSLRYQGKLYGLPFMGSTVVLYYNKEMITTPASTLSELLIDVENGDSVALTADFKSLYWGIGAFGGQLFSTSDNGNSTVELSPDDYTEWFNWLKTAQTRTGVVIDNDPELLNEKFTDGEIAYLIAPIDLYRQFEETLGHDKLGMTMLPGVEYAPEPDTPEKTLIQNAGPLFSIQTIVFSQASDEATFEIALELAQFLHNPTLQRKMVLENVERLPTNLKVFISPNLSTVGNALVRQSRSAVTVPLNQLAEFDALSSDANTLYVGLLEGGVSPQETTDSFLELLSSSFGTQ
jgi:arabinogalactan oligomer/maltooligosaccharide transport system substrate-binding protein